MMQEDSSNAYLRIGLQWFRLRNSSWEVRKYEGSRWAWRVSLDVKKIFHFSQQLRSRKWF